ncbi:MAG: quinone-dependent dihydroorotate dehydrogenase [Candidatus Spechtbacterales bacterium]
MLYETIIGPALFKMSEDPEVPHKLSIRALQTASRIDPLLQLMEQRFGVNDTSLRRTVWDINFPNPLGLAAGFDKDGRAILGLQALGFGYLEIGTVVPLLQPGREGQRIWRYPKVNALGNAMGFPSEGKDKVYRTVAPLRAAGRIEIPVGMNIGPNKETVDSGNLERVIADYLACLETLAELADYIVVNVSSPNTPGLRELQNPVTLGKIIRVLREALDRLIRILGRSIPLVVKFSPDEEEKDLERMVRACEAAGVDGFCATNTTLSRDGVPAIAAERPGGISGEPLFERALRVVSHICSLTDLPVIGVGGISSTQRARRMMTDEYQAPRARLIQGLTGFAYVGPSYAKNINKGLIASVA